MDDGIRRVLIDADYGADGIWWVLTSDEMSPPPPPGYWSGNPPGNSQRSTPAWPQLSEELRDELKRWNDEMMGTAPSATSELSALQERGRVLAYRVQQQLGKGFEVLYPFGTRIYRVDHLVTGQSKPGSRSCLGIHDDNLLEREHRGSASVLFEQLCIVADSASSTIGYVINSSGGYLRRFAEYEPVT